MAILLEMVSDVVCPWCWLGLRRTLAAIDLFEASDTVELRFAPFELDPSIPEKGVDYRAYMQAKFSSDGEDEASTDRWTTMRAMLEAYGEAEDIPFRFTGIPKRPNTFNAHRLIRWAQGQKMGAQAKELLFNAYFNEHRDIGDPHVLASIGQQIGLYPDVILKLLEEAADVKPLREEAAFFRQLGVQGVPTLIANRRFAMQGAESIENIVGLLRQAQAAEDADAQDGR